MRNQLLLKGFEVELFTGRPSGEHVGVANEVKRDLPDFVTEPDQRNLEYITLPHAQYQCLREALLEPRRRLREWLAPRHLTLLPGSTLSLGDSSRFERSDLSNSYHQLIETSYGSKVVTASIHINLGLEDLPLLFAALRLVRCEAALFLSLSASSPFLDGSITGAHSQRWSQFPRTPEHVPLFIDHNHYVAWVEENLANGVMWNERHLWTSVRPNGPSRPYDLNRLELRICDLITDPNLLLAVTTLLELRVLSLLKHPDKFDPLLVSQLNARELETLSEKNDVSASQQSLDATLYHWCDGSPVLCRDWIEKLLLEMSPLAMELGLEDYLLPLHLILDQGNQAIQWLHHCALGKSVEDVLQDGIETMISEESQIQRSEVIL